MLLCLGLGACNPTQPDVSAHTIMTVLEQTEGSPDTLPITLGALYETVEVLDRGETQDSNFIRLSLGRDGAERATLRCDTVRRGTQFDDALVQSVTDLMFFTAMQIPMVPGRERRVLCRFTYFDRRAARRAFVAQASMWAAAHIAPTKKNTANETIATIGDMTKALHVFESKQGARKSAVLLFLTNLP